MAKCEIAVIGSGIAGAVASVQMQELNKDYLLIHDEKSVKHRPVWISEDYTQNYPETRIGMRPTDSVRLMSNQVDFSIGHVPGKYWVINPREVIYSIKKRVEASRAVEIDLRRHHPKITKTGSKFKISGLGETIIAEKIINATGIDGKIEGGHKPGDYLVESLFGASLKGSLEKNEMILVFLPAGGTCWIANSVYDGYIDAVVTAWGPKEKSKDFFVTANERLSKLIDFVESRKGINISSKKTEDTYKGTISAHKFNHPLANGVYPFGELAQTARPASQESFNRILQTGADLKESIEKNHTPIQLLTTINQKHMADIFMYAGLLARMATYNPQLEGGGSINAIYKMLNNVKPEKRLDLEKKFEDWIQHGNVDKGFILKTALSDKELLKSLLLSGGAYLIAGLIGTERLFKSTKLMNDRILKRGYFNN